MRLRTLTGFQPFNVNLQNSCRDFVVPVPNRYVEQIFGSIEGGSESTKVSFHQAVIGRKGLDYVRTSHY